MYQPMLYLHWKQIRLGLIPLMLASFGLPLLTVQGLVAAAGQAGLEPFEILVGIQDSFFLYPVLAGAIGVTMALSAWNWDHQLNHVHALSLPLSRTEYVMLKMGAGATLLLLPVASLWIGCHVASLSVPLPEGIHAYPNLLALRFLMASLVCYALLFAMAAGTIKTTLWVSSLFIGFLVIGGPLNEFLGLYFDFFDRHNLVEMTIQALANSPGPAEVLNGNWALFDV